MGRYEDDLLLERAGDALLKLHGASEGEYPAHPEYRFKRQRTRNRVLSLDDPQFESVCVVTGNTDRHDAELMVWYAHVTIGGLDALTQRLAGASYREIGRMYCRAPNTARAMVRDCIRRLRSNARGMGLYWLMVEVIAEECCLSRSEVDWRLQR